MQFYSKYGEDQWIAEHLKLPDKGTYVDVGCGHPTQFSNTAFLRDRGWNGVAVDANAAYAKEWRNAGIPRPGSDFLVGVCAEKPVAKFLIHDNSATSRLCPNGVSYAAVTLEQIVTWYDIGNIDLLSLDVEGAEFEVFKTLDRMAHEPEIIIAEYVTTVEEKPNEEDFRLRDYLCVRGYRLVHKTQANMIYILHAP